MPIEHQQKEVMLAEYTIRVCGRKEPARSSVRKSNLPCKVPHMAFEGFRKLGKRFKGDLLFRPFDVANVISRQFGLFRQLLLAQTGLLPPGADGLPQNAINSARR